MPTPLRLLLTAVSLPLIALALNFSACKNPCKDVTCDNLGAPVEEGDDCRCDCRPGYSGARCTSLWLNDIIGLYDVSYTCTGNGPTDPADSYFSNLDAVGSGSATEFRFTNFAGYNSTAIGTLSSATTFSLREDNVDPNFQGMTFSGSGTVFGDSIVVSYNVVYNGTLDICEATYKKR